MRCSSSSRRRVVFFLSRRAMRGRREERRGARHSIGLRSTLASFSTVAAKSLHRRHAQQRQHARGRHSAGAAPARHAPRVSSAGDPSGASPPISSHDPAFLLANLASSIAAALWTNLAKALLSILSHFVRIFTLVGLRPIPTWMVSAILVYAPENKTQCIAMPLNAKTPMSLRSSVSIATPSLSPAQARPDRHLFPDPSLPASQTWSA